MALTQREQEALDAIRWKIMALRRYLTEYDAPHDENLDEWFDFLSGLAYRQGNIGNQQGYLATLLAKRFLQTRFPITGFDAAEKPQGAPGLDIDLMTDDGQRIVGEIRTTAANQPERYDLGAAQKATFRKDFAKLNAAEADHKFLFVTDRDTYEIVLQRYMSEIPGVEVVLL
jgi:hypothetical protein